jgi:hypothetical protein
MIKITSFSLHTYPSLFMKVSGRERERERERESTLKHSLKYKKMIEHGS